MSKNSILQSIQDCLSNSCITASLTTVLAKPPLQQKCLKSVLGLGILGLKSLAAQALKDATRLALKDCGGEKAEWAADLGQKQWMIVDYLKPTADGRLVQHA